MTNSKILVSRWFIVMLTAKRFVSPSLFVVCSSIAFAFAFIFYSIPTSVAQTSAPPSLLSYENPNYGIKIQYPNDWTASPSGIPVYNGIIGFYPPLKNITDIPTASVKLLVTTYAPTISLDDYTKATIGALEQQGIKIDESNPNTLAGKPGHRITYSPSNQETPNAPVNFKVMETWTVMENKVYLISFSADSQKFASYLPTVQKMLDSMQIQPPLA
ncbi:MAG: hypothetical protein H0X50_12065 [Nitrosopumilus sp.]|nr:hypothetical protein [Nitrosopumilus sp.]